MTSSALTPASLLQRWRTALRTALFLPDPDREPAFTDHDIAQLHAATATPATAAIDSQTWVDLLIGQYSRVLSQGVSIFGQQELVRRLRAGSDEAACAVNSVRIKALLADPAQRDAFDQACKPLRGADVEIASLLFGVRQTVRRPGWTRWIGLLGPGFLVALLATFAWPLAWAAVGIAFALLLAIRFRYIAAIEQWKLSMASLQRMLAACDSLDRGSGPLLEGFIALRGQAGRINRSLSRSPIVAANAMLQEYLDWFMLSNVLHYLRCVERVEANIATLRQCYLLIASLEADCALARHLAATPRFCWAERHSGEGAAIRFDEVVNPLLAQAMPLSLALDGKGAFISGQNGVGKSTLLRTIGLNLVVARGFGFCYANEATVSTRPVYASMQNEDAMLGGESLYIAELRRAREMLASTDGPHGGIYIIDEIFRGTNHLESVSAAAAVLETLASKAVVIVSSHNLVLAPLLGACLSPLYVSASDDEPRRLTLQPGVLVHTNGIALLAERGFDARIQARASEVFDWLNHHLAHPAVPDGVALASRE